MSNSATTRQERLDNAATTPWIQHFLALRIAAIVALCSAAFWFTQQCVSQLEHVEAGGVSTPTTLLMPIVAFIACLVLVLLVEVCNMTRRFRAPEQQVRVAMQRIRAGDIGFRLARRPGEPMARLVGECNGLLEWLNRNPPGDVRVDGDVFELDADGGGRSS